MDCYRPRFDRKPRLFEVGLLSQFGLGLTPLIRPASRFRNPPSHLAARLSFPNICNPPYTSPLFCECSRDSVLATGNLPKLTPKCV